MIIQLENNGTTYKANLAAPIDISIPLQSGTNNPNCFFAPYPSFTPIQTDSFIGDTTKGGTVNFYNIQLNPHGNGTHTECVGHIAKEKYYIKDCLKQYHNIGLLITIEPSMQEDGDYVITKTAIQEQVKPMSGQNTPMGGGGALLVRTTPNTTEKLTRNYSNTNPPYFTAEAMEYIVSLGIQHLMVDLPSVDREVDEGKLTAHHVFWQYPHQTRVNATITELVYIPNTVADGFYLVNIQVMPIALDASSSNIVLYKLN